LILHFFTLNSLQSMISWKNVMRKRMSEVTSTVCYPFLQIYFLWWRMTCIKGRVCIPSLPCRLQLSLLDIESYVHGSDVFTSTAIELLFDTLLWKRRMWAARYVTSRAYFLSSLLLSSLFLSGITKRREAREEGIAREQQRQTLRHRWGKFVS
jgi:hypothetical protein